MQKNNINTVLMLAFLVSINVFSQQLQDSTLNNLILPVGYKTGDPGELGEVKKTGSGKTSMILIPGLGFGGEVFDNFVEENKNNYTMYVITPAGFGGTHALSMPDTSVKYSELTWTNNIVAGILTLIEKEKLNKPVIVAHFITASQVAFNLALYHPYKIGKIVILCGSPYWYYPGRKDGQWTDWAHEKTYNAGQRANLVDVYWAPKWFKTVTKKTWDSNMWKPEDYCKDTLTGRRLYDASADVPIQVMIRYLLEYLTYDVSEQYKQINVPALFLIPDFNGLETDSSKQYLKYFFREEWKTARESGNTNFQFQTIPDSRIFIWYDNPIDTYRAINNFIKQ